MLSAGACAHAAHTHTGLQQVCSALACSCSPWPSSPALVGMLTCCAAAVDLTLSSAPVWPQCGPSRTTSLVAFLTQPLVQSVPGGDTVAVSLLCSRSPAVLWVLSHDFSCFGRDLLVPASYPSTRRLSPPRCLPCCITAVSPAHVPHSCIRSPPATTSRSGRSVITSGIYSACGGSVV